MYLLLTKEVSKLSKESHYKSREHTSCLKCNVVKVEPSEHYLSYIEYLKQSYSSFAHSERARWGNSLLNTVTCTSYRSRSLLFICISSSLLSSKGFVRPVPNTVYFILIPTFRFVVTRCEFKSWTIGLPLCKVSTANFHICRFCSSSLCGETNSIFSD